MTSLAYTPSTSEERAFLGADATWDGRFVAAVRTTGIFCRPSCRARKPLPANVEYFRNPAEASAAGYRACLRCHPERQTAVTSRTFDSPLGPMLAAASDAGICLHEFTDRPMLPAQLAAVRRRIGPPGDGDHPLLEQLRRELNEYFAGERREFGVPLDAPGSAFQERVWSELREIPYGETISYRQLAERVGAARAPRAVGRANGANRLAIVIPCHRVVTATGRLGGYGGGVDRKEWLLRLEAGQN